MPIWKPYRRCAALGAAASLALAGCSNDSADGNEPGSDDRAALVELSERLEGADGHAYTAEYLVEGTGDSVVVAVDPDEGTGAVVVDDRPEFWSGESDQLASWISGELADMLPSDEEVSEWLSAAAEDPSSSVEFSDTTLGGELADCVDVQGAVNSPVGAYKVCVTTVGVIASVSAQVGEVTYTAKLVNYNDGVDGAWLDELGGASQDTDE